MKRIFYLFFLLLEIYAYSADFYVSTTGSNSNSGTISSPYKTIDYAAGLASPGDAVWVRGGTYTNASFGNGSIWNSETAVTINNVNGTSAGYITIRPYTNENAIIQTDGNYGILIKNSSYLKIIGFEVKGMSESITQAEAWANWGIYKNPDDGTIHNLATELGIDPSNPALIGQNISKPAFAFNETRPAYYNSRGIVANNSHHIEITENKVHHCPQSGIRAEGSDYITISGNEVYSNTYYTSAGVGAITVSGSINIDTNNTVKFILEKNKVYNNENRMVSWNGAKTSISFVIDEGSGIFFTRNNDSAVPLSQQYQFGYFMVRNNICYQNGAGGITVHKTNKTIVENNTLYKNGNDNDGSPGGIGINTVDDVIIRNNIVYAKPNKFALGIVALPANNVRVGNNVLYNENGTEPITNKIDGTNITSYTATNGGWVTANPSFKNVSQLDFHLNANSPAVNYGSNLTSATDDFVGTARDSQPDAGAYEYVAGLAVKEASFNQLKIYPNPANDLLNIFVQNTKDIKVFSIVGEDVTAWVRNVSHEGNLLKIDVSGLKSGIYFIKTAQDFIKFIKK